MSREVLFGSDAGEGEGESIYLLHWRYSDGSGSGVYSRLLSSEEHDLLLDIEECVPDGVGRSYMLVTMPESLLVRRVSEPVAVSAPLSVDPSGDPSDGSKLDVYRKRRTRLRLLQILGLIRVGALSNAGSSLSPSNVKQIVHDVEAIAADLGIGLVPEPEEPTL